MSTKEFLFRMFQNRTVLTRTTNETNRHTCDLVNRLALLLTIERFSRLARFNHIFCKHHVGQSNQFSTLPATSWRCLNCSGKISGYAFCIN